MTVRQANNLSHMWPLRYSLAVGASSYTRQVGNPPKWGLWIGIADIPFCVGAGE